MPTTPTITQTKPAYKVTVRDFFLVFRPETEGVAAYEDTIHQLPVIKEVTVTPDANEKKIYASGIVYAQTTRVSGTDLGVNAVALPAAIVRRAAGETVVGASGVSYGVSNPVRVEFGCGFVTELSDGGKEYRFYPRCVLNIPEETHSTSEDEDPDPEDQYTISALPTDEKVTRVFYSTANCASGKVPISEAAFFGARPYLKSEIEALAALEVSG